VGQVVRDGNGVRQFLLNRNAIDSHPYKGGGWGCRQRCSVTKITRQSATNLILSRLLSLKLLFPEPALLKPAPDDKILEILSLPGTQRSP